MTRAGRLLISLALVGTAATTSVPRGRHFARLAGPVSVPAEAAAATPAATPAAPLAAPAQTAVRPRRGGSLVATLRSEPRTLNPLTGRDFASTLVASLTHARLLRINRATQQLEPWLAESYACSADGLSCMLKLRRGVTFSDGAPFTSADVVFSFRAVY
ncbi:MAG TPA: ABC transporter substrate-binding protein, partial [Vicinamibacterales bacterium]|nr:ABC transporter substrate-binding protein [Vicinamibacterales bacterium]